MRTLKKYLHWSYSSSGNGKPFLLVFPCRRTRLYLHRSSETEGGPARSNWICNIISLRTPRISWIRGAVWQNDLYAFHSAPSGIYTRPRIFYLWFRDTPDDENRENTVGRPRGIAAPLTDKMEEGPPTKFPLRADIRDGRTLLHIRSVRE